MIENFCWLCGSSQRPADWHASWWLQKAHIASGQGRAVRVEDDRAIVILCPRCHSCHVSDSDRVPAKNINGTDYPTIDERHTLWLKIKMDPSGYDPEFLQKIWIGSLPRPEAPPSHWLQELSGNTGIMWI